MHVLCAIKTKEHELRKQFEGYLILLAYRRKETASKFSLRISMSIVLSSSARISNTDWYLAEEIFEL